MSVRNTMLEAERKVQSRRSKRRATHASSTGRKLAALLIRPRAIKGGPSILTDSSRMLDFLDLSLGAVADRFG